MKNIYKLILMFGCTFQLSCSRDLKLSPVSNITANSFWRTADDVKGALNGMYVRFRLQASANLFLWGEARSELLTSGLQATPYAQYYNNTLNSAEAGPEWLGLYTVIHDANLLLKYVPDIEFQNAQEKNNILAEAYAMRAFAYFVMARTWGGVPLKTSPTEGFDPQTTYIPRNSVEEVFVQIKEDVEAALGLFANSNYPAGRCQWSKPAVLALKGDVYLWSGKRLNGGNADFQTALTALEEIKNTDVLLLPGYDNVFRQNNKGNKEILMAVHFRDLEATNTIYSNMYLQPAQIPVNLDVKSKNLIGAGGGQNYATPRPEVRNLFTPDDSRRDATFVEAYTVTSPDDSTYYTTVSLKFRGFVDAGTRKYLDDVILYRFADVLLMIAEAKNAMNGDPTTEINQIRQRAYGDAFPAYVFTSTTKEDNDDAILQERLLELSFEGKRWWDLIRFGKAFERVPSLIGRQNEQHLLLFPISEATISQDPSIIQNPGY